MNLEDIVNRAPLEIKQGFSKRSYRKENYMIQPFDENNCLYILMSGSAEVITQSYSGSMLSLYRYRSFSCFGEVEIFNNRSKTISVIAKTDCETITLSKEMVLKWMRLDFDFTQYLMEQLAAKLITSSEITAKLLFLSMKDRVLSNIYAHYKMGDLDALTKQALSNEVCAPIRSLNRTIAQCIQEDFIRFHNKKFEIVSVERLNKHLDKMLF